MTTTPPATPVPGTPTTGVSTVGNNSDGTPPAAAPITNTASATPNAVASGIGALFSGFGTVLNGVLTKVETYGEDAVKWLEGEEVLFATYTVDTINAIEVPLNLAKTYAASLPVIGKELAAIISTGEELLDNAKFAAISLETGAAQAPGGETNV